MAEVKNSSGASQPIIEQFTNEQQWIPDVYYFPIQVSAELERIQGNLLGKILTLIDALGLIPKQEKATKDLIRTYVKEQMISTRSGLDKRLSDLFRLGMKPIDTKSHSSSDDSFFTHSYRVQPIYDSEESLEGDGDGKIRIGGIEV